MSKMALMQARILLGGVSEEIGKVEHQLFDIGVLLDTMPATDEFHAVIKSYRDMVLIPMNAVYTDYRNYLRKEIERLENGISRRPDDRTPSRRAS